MQGNGSMMAGLISASASGWAGLGFAAQPGEMLGANAIIVMPCDSCPTGLPCYPKVNFDKQEAL